ncbi:MAG: hypothetical protein K9M99_04915 [Candidatus Cloacimonetes bacterium]|nr:hypothetical protein [Candidatus Cloacimonadota bacterium]
MPFKNKLKDVDYFMNQMGHGIKDSFNEEQEKHIRLILAKAIRIPSKKLIDLNVPFWFIKKYYMQLYVGEDKRQGSRKPGAQNQTSENIIERDFSYFYSLIPPEVVKTLNFEQKRAVQDILKRCIMVPTKKIYESNKTYKIFSKYYYISFFLGFDKRKILRQGGDTTMRGMNMSVRGFIYFVELALAVGIIYALIRILGTLINFNPSDAIEKGMLDDVIDQKLEERINDAYSLPNPFQLIDYYWWNYLRPFI